MWVPGQCHRTKAQNCIGNRELSTDNRDSARTAVHNFDVLRGQFLVSECARAVRNNAVQTLSLARGVPYSHRKTTTKSVRGLQVLTCQP